MRTFALPLSLFLLAAPALAQERLPILDVHLHAMTADAMGPPPAVMCTPIVEFPAWDPAIPYFEAIMNSLREMEGPPCDDPVWSPETDEELMRQTIEAMERRNVVGVLSGPPDRVLRWLEAAPGRFIPSVQLQIGRDDYPLDSLRALFEGGPFAVLGEVSNQYVGIAPDDERMAPYWALAEELDLPVGIHVGAGPPGAAAMYPGYAARLSSAQALEPVLARHPRLRVFVMHAGWPRLDDLLAILYTHPQVHVDVSYLVYALPRPEFYRYLRRIVEAGFTNRVMFGSDQMVWPGVIERSVAVIEEAPFLSEQQKRAILYDNAARFLRLSEEEIARHHGR